VVDMAIRVGANLYSLAAIAAAEIMVIKTSEIERELGIIVCDPFWPDSEESFRLP
jgi:hypothetical protein